jgi:endopolyphosphatase
LTGRFIHITDFHPDPFYKAGATFQSGCHDVEEKKKHVAAGMGGELGDNDEEVQLKKGKSKKEDEVAGPWGSGVS